MNNETEVQPHETSESMKMRVEKRTAELASKPKVGKPLEDGKTPIAELKTLKSEVKPESPQGLNAPVTKTGEQSGVTTPKEEVDPIEWARKKGLTSEESIARSLREMESEFHRRNQGKWQAPAQNAPQPVTAPPPPSYTAPVQGYQQPSVPMQIPRQLLENIGRQYNMNVDDAEKLLNFNRDFYESMMVNERKRHDQEMTEFRRENTRNSEFRSLMLDPAFKHPQVQMEVSRILKEDPTAFEREPEPFKWAYKEALVEMARRNLQGNETTDSSNASMFTPPTKPPTQLGTSAGAEPVGLSAQEFARLPVEDKAKILNQMGARKEKPY